MNGKIRIAILASGRGSNAQKIVEYSKQAQSSYEVSCILSNRKSAGVLDFARNEGIRSRHVPKKMYSSEFELLEYLFDQKVDLIVLAGFLKLIPKFLVEAFPKRIINIHPALLPKYGGKGMYGRHVHQAVFNAEENTSGMTIHYVDEHYDQGEIIFQVSRRITSSKSPNEIGERVLELEHCFYSKVVDGVSRKVMQSNMLNAK